ncbi:unnamed protein product [Linum tenue]|uniref:Uncharacterized protein n=1 Tax=Linum tenue TaxID=586396 RepID=A0AAV0R6B5_9ROSI|nr:unnamed protein product [Linum tenue]
MGRGRVELKRIENKINRQVTFAKRRNGLLKKAYELSVLCDAEVALIIFSNRGKLYEFCSTNNMLKTLERYQKCSYGAVEVNKPAKELEQSSYREYLKLKGRYEGLQRTQRNLLGEDLGPLNTKELEQLERQLEGSLKQVRSTKGEAHTLYMVQFDYQEQLLLESNRALAIKVISTLSSYTFFLYLLEIFHISLITTHLVVNCSWMKSVRGTACDLPGKERIITTCPMETTIIIHMLNPRGFSST